jgi:hypothetical protein
MSLYSFQETLVASQVAGTAKTAIAAGSILDPSSVITLPAQYWQVGRVLRIKAFGLISCVVTTPGTARFDVRLGATVVFDSQAINLNVVAKTNVGWNLEIVLTCRTIGSGTAATLAGQGRFMSEAVVGSPLPTVGGSGMVMLPYNAATVVGPGFNSTAAATLDLFHTQTVATGSITVHQYTVESLI